MTQDRQERCSFKLVSALVIGGAMIAFSGGNAFAQIPCQPGRPCNPTPFPSCSSGQICLRPVTEIKVLPGHPSAIEELIKLNPRAIQQLQQEDPQALQKLRQGDSRTIQRLQILAPNLRQQIQR